MKNLREIMEDRNLTVKELAAKSKLPPKSIKELMDRSRIANIEEILRLADALNLSVKEMGIILVQDERFEKFRKRSNRFFSYRKFQELLDKQQLNATKFSEMTGIHINTIFRWKNLGDQPSKENIQLIADTLGCTINDFCEFPNENESSKRENSQSLSQSQKAKVKEFDSDALLYFIAVHRLSIQKISQLSGIDYYQLYNLKMGLQIRRFELDQLCDCLNVEEKVFTEKNELTACARKCQSKYDPRIFSKAFLFLTEKYSISQYLLSAILDISFGTIKHWISGYGVPIIEQAILLSEFFGVMPDFFLIEPEGSVPDFIKQNHLFENESEPLFAKRLRQMLQEKHMTQAELVRQTRTDLIHVGFSAMVLYCAGDRVPRKQIMHRLAEVLEVDPDWLSGGSTFNPLVFQQKIKLSGLSKVEILNRTGISMEAIHHWCHSECTPNNRDLEKIATILNCELKDFFVHTPILLDESEKKYTDSSHLLEYQISKNIEKERENNTMSNNTTKIHYPEYTHKKLKQAMKKAGFTIKDLAEKMNIAPSTVSHWTCGDRIPTPKAMTKLFEIFDFSIDEPGSESYRFNNETFKKQLDASGFSINELSKKSRINRSTIYNWYCGRAKNPALKHLRPVASLLNCPVDMFYDLIDTESESLSIKVEAVSSCEPVDLPKSSADSPSFILSEEDLEPGIVQARLSIMENGRTMTFRKLISELQRCRITIPEFAYEIGFSKSEIEFWKKSPKELSEAQIKTISEFLKVDPDSVPTSVKELEIDKAIQKLVNDLPKWSYQDLEKLLDFITEKQLDFEFRMF